MVRSSSLARIAGLTLTAAVTLTACAAQEGQPGDDEEIGTASSADTPIFTVPVPTDDWMIDLRPVWARTCDTPSARITPKTYFVRQPASKMSCQTTVKNGVSTKTCAPLKCDPINSIGGSWEGKPLEAGIAYCTYTWTTTKNAWPDYTGLRDTAKAALGQTKPFQPSRFYKTPDEKVLVYHDPLFPDCDEAATAAEVAQLTKVPPVITTGVYEKDLPSDIPTCGSCGTLEGGNEIIVVLPPDTAARPHVVLVAPTLDNRAETFDYEPAGRQVGVIRIDPDVAATLVPGTVSVRAGGMAKP